MNIQQFRQQYPEYKGMDDATLTAKLHAKFYSHVPLETFAERFQVKPPSAKTVPAGTTAEPSKLALQQQEHDLFTGTPGGVSKALQRPSGFKPPEPEQESRPAPEQEFRPAPERKFFQNLLIAKDRLLPPWAQATRREKAEKVLRGATGTVANVVTKPLHFASQLFWALGKRVAPDLIDEEVKGMNLDQAVNHLAGRDPTGLESVLGGVAAFVGPTKIVKSVVGGAAGRITQSAVEWGGGEAIIQLSNRLAEVADPNADYGYEGAVAVAKAGAKGAGFGAIGTLPVSKSVQTVAQSAMMGGSAAAEGADLEEIITQATIPFAFRGIEVFQQRQKTKAGMKVLRGVLEEELSQEFKRIVQQRLEEVTKAVDQGKHDPPRTADHAIGRKYGLSNEQTDGLLAAAEQRYRELKHKTVEQRKGAPAKQKQVSREIPLNEVRIEVKRSSSDTHNIYANGKWVASVRSANNRFEAKAMFLEDHPEYDVRNAKPRVVKETVTKPSTGEHAELAFLSRNRKNIETLLSDVTSGKPVSNLEISGVEQAPSVPAKTRRELINFAHNMRDQMTAAFEGTGLPAAEARSEAGKKYTEALKLVHDFKDKRPTSKALSRPEFKEFTDLLASYLPEGAIPESMWDAHVNVSGESVTMNSIMDGALEAAVRLPPKGLSKVVSQGKAASGIIWAKKYTVGTGNMTVQQLAKILDGGNEYGPISRVLGDNIQRGYVAECAHTQIADGLFQAGLKGLGIDIADTIRMSRSLDPRLKVIKAVANRLPGNMATTTELNKVDLGGMKASLTWAELLDIYLIAGQSDGVRHATSGGFLVGGKLTGAVTEAQLSTVRKMVDANPKVKGVVDLIRFIENTHWKSAINDTSVKLDGRAIATVPDWWGLEPYEGTKLGGKGYGINLLEDRSIFRPRPKGNQPLVVRDAFNRYAVFQSAIAQYVGMAEPFRIARTLVNDGQLFRELDQKGYGDVHKTIAELLKRQQTELSHSVGPLDGLVDAVMPNMYRALLFFNPRVWASQYTSVAGYGSYVSPEFMPYALEAMKIRGIGNAINEMLMASPVAYMRMKSGRASLELGAVSESEATLRRVTGRGLQVNALGEIIKWSDIAALLGGWQAAKAEFAAAQNGSMTGKSQKWWTAENIGKIREGSPEYTDVVRRRAEYLWQQTQSSWDPYNRSLLSSAPKLTRSFFLFRSFHEKLLKTWSDAHLDYKNGESATEFASRVSWPVVGMVADQVIRIAISAALYRERKSLLENTLDMGGQVLRTVPILGSIVDNTIRSFVRGISGEKGIYVSDDVLDSLPVDTANRIARRVPQLAEGIGKYTESDGEEGGDAIERAIRGIICDVAPTVGVPSSQIKKIGKGWFPEEEEFRR